ncbi:hypothetical protein Syun_010913 [Stephania yunnanensis]|uniref:3-hydroxyisobutyryl-CoA hydrolase n=1 Tax=Stephania yunnanensis TaxID=152371 RepID=A0AAP0JXV7_9MAGN
MQSFRAMYSARNSLRRLSSITHRSIENFSAQPHYTEINLHDEVLIEGKANARAAVLNRPSALNSITTSMASRLKKLYESWEENNDIGFVMMKGSGRAFCAGGDVVTLYRLINEVLIDWLKEFFTLKVSNMDFSGSSVTFDSLSPFLSASLYDCSYVYSGQSCLRILGYSLTDAGKQEESSDILLQKLDMGGNSLNVLLFLRNLIFVAILDGITMGPGVGISVPGTFRVATDKTVFGHPETQIGFHPDSGASFYLSRLPGYLGEYLALTGDTLNGVDMLACGLATHFCLNARLEWIEERLAKLITDDPSVIETSLKDYGDLVYPDKRSVLHKIETIDRCFGQDTVEEIIDALENEVATAYDDWCTLTLKKLKQASPLSLKVSLKSIREGRFQSLDQCLAREYRISLRALSNQVSHDFCEGVRARLVDKDYSPKWDPPSLEDVSKDMVNYHFAPLSEAEPELELPTALREPFV